MYRSLFVVVFLIWLGWSSTASSSDERPNLLLITVDDMNADSVGVFGSSIVDTTPSIDRLAREGMRFLSAHVQVANCMPSRNVMWTGRYPHSNGVEGFTQVRDPRYPTLFGLARDAGYFTAIRHKLKDSTPYSPYPWDLVLDKSPAGANYNKKDPFSYGIVTSEGISRAKAAGKPFLLLINIADPHIPLYGLNKKGSSIEDPFKPSRVYRAEEVQVPGYLSDDPVMRKELAHYYSSVRRADDAVGQVLEALERSGESENTLVILLADHGMPFPFAKTQLYHHSTRTPLVVRWPQVINAGSIDTKHMVSAVDILPTILDGIGVDIPQGVEGRSFFTLLKGNTQEDREWVIKEYNENAAGDRTPMRAVESHRFLYIFNPWSNGIRVMRSATKNTQSHKRMLELAKDDATIARRLAMLDHRVLEEFYDIQVDPDCLVNLIGDPAYQSEIANYRAILEEWMRDTADPMFSTFVNRNDSQVLEDYMLEQNQIVLKRRAWIKAIRQSQRKKNGA